MATVREMENRLLEVKNRIPSETDSIITRLAQRIIELNTDQLFQGKDTRGTIVGFYSQATQEMSEGMTGQGYPKIAGDPYNFYDTGDLFNHFTLDFHNGKLDIFSTDQKVSELQAKYGKHLFGLTIERQHVLNYDLLKPELLRFIKRIISG